MDRYVFFIPDEKKTPTGGIMNIVRHAALARRLGGSAVLATESGKDPHGRYWFRHDVPIIRWSQRQTDDVCVIPDFFTDRVADVRGPCVVFMQSPLWLKDNFDHTRPNLRIWTDSPAMLEKCRQRYPGHEIPIVPNIVDHGVFPFIPQSRREPGMILVFPRKGPQFIEAVFHRYRRDGGRYWRPKVVDGLRFDKLVRLFQRPQAFLASADFEGCALPPQESMAAGVVVVGKDAGGANFSMRHGETALVDSTAEGTARCLSALEDAGLRTRLAGQAFDFIKRFFSAAEPTRFWKKQLGLED